MGTRDKINELLRVFLGSDSSIATILNDLDERTFTFVKAADDTLATTETTEYPVCVVPADCKLVSVQYVTAGTVTADDTDYAMFQLWKRDGEGGDAVLIASITTESTGTDDIAAYVPTGITLADPPYTSIAEGSVLSFAIAKEAAGVVIPAGAFVLTFLDV